MVQRVDHRVHHRRRRANGAEFAHTLGTQAVGQAGHALIERSLEADEHIGMRQGVVHEAGAEQLALRVVGHALAQSLADALDRAAFHLAAHDGRAHDAADVVDRGVGHDLHVARGGVDFDLANVATIGPTRRTGLGAAFGQQHRRRLAPREIEQVDRQVGAGHRETTGRVFDVSGRSFQSLRSQILAMLNGALRRHAHCRAAGEERPAARAAKAVGAVGVALQDADAIDVYAKHIDR